MAPLPTISVYCPLSPYHDHDCAYAFPCHGQLLLFSPDEIPNAVAHARKHPEQLPYLVLSSVCGYVSVSFVLLMIKMYGATVTEMVKSLRKARAPTLTRTPTL